MKFSINVNQKVCVDLGLTFKHGALLDLLTQLSTWANDEVIEGSTYYSLSYNKVIDELPTVFDKEDTVYRHLKKLRELGLLEQKKAGKNQLNFVRLTAKGKKLSRVGLKPEPSQGSDSNPRRVGLKPEPRKQALDPINTTNSSQGSDSNPNILYISYTKDNIYTHGPYFFLKKNDPISVEAFEIQNKKRIQNWEGFIINFNCKVEEEELAYEVKILFRRLNRMASNWKNFGEKQTDVIPITNRRRIG